MLSENELSCLSELELEQVFNRVLELKFSEQATKNFLLLINQLLLSSPNPPSHPSRSIQGFQIFRACAAALRSKMRAIELPRYLLENTVDVCGTGGDGLHTLSISTAVSFIVAAAGIPVSKHGNRAVSSRCGSFDVLFELGISATDEVEKIKRDLSEKNLCFIFAPLFHPALKTLSKIRRELGVSTIFNFVAPTLNPTQVKFQLVGTSVTQTMKPIAEVLKASGSKKAYIVNGLDGMDEVSRCADSNWLKLENGKIEELELISLTQLGFKPARIEELKGGNAKYNASRLLALLDGKDLSVYREIVALNAAFVLHLASKAKSIRDGILLAYELLDSGKAKATLAKFR